MRRFGFLLFLMLFLGGTAYILYHSSPKLRSLFVPRQEVENPLAFLEELPPLSPQARNENTPPSPQVRTPETIQLPPPAPAEPDRPSRVNTVPNEEVARVLMQILQAKGLASGLTLAVSDEEIQVGGQVDSPEARESILRILEQGREARRLEATRLHVRTAPPAKTDAEPAFSEP